MDTYANKKLVADFRNTDLSGIATVISRKLFFILDKDAFLILFLLVFIVRQINVSHLAITPETKDA